MSTENCDVYLHAEIELLKKTVVDKQSQLIAMETACMQEHDRQAELEDSIIAWQDKYDRLYESHKRVQKVNQNLEDKLLKLVDRNSGERAQLTSDVATLSVRLAQANYTIANLQREIERYKADMGLAIQLLQCKPDSFVPQKITSLPIEMQTKVATYMRLDTNSHSDSEGSTSGVGVATSGSYSVLPASDSPTPTMCPFPPTAMVYSMRGLDGKIEEPLIDTSIDMSPPRAKTQQPLINISNTIINTHNHNNNHHHINVSPSIMAKFLEDELKSSELIKHCDTCACSLKELQLLADTPKTFSIGTQTLMHGNNLNSLCLRCNSNLNSPSRANSPYIMKLAVKSSCNASVVSDGGRSSVGVGTVGSAGSGASAAGVMMAMKKDDLTVNPILSHHRLCDRTTRPLPTTISHSPPVQPTEVDIAEVTAKNISSYEVILADSSGKEEFILNSPTVDSLKSVALDLKELEMRVAKDIANGVEGGGGSGGDVGSGESIAGDKSVIKTENSLSGAGQGSTNSLWSRTSSNTEGIKMFENFNLNLIKTIKAENPKMPGPRLCSLRIPNGSNNILLDNFEPTLSPIVYTKRSRFVDEELSDTKDVILTPGRTPTETKISMVMSNNDIVVGVLNTADLNDNKTDSEKYRDAQSKEIVTNGSVLPATNIIVQPSDAELSEKISASSKIITTTQSSSVSNSNVAPDVLDVKECAILRRQQLTRVAEWVQNNSIQNVNDDSNDESASDYNNISSTAKLHNILATNDSILISSSDAQPNINNNQTLNPSTMQCSSSSSINNNNNSATAASATATTTKTYIASLVLCDDKKLVNDFAQNNNLLHNNMINNNEEEEEEEVETTPNDIAQMEFNVRQFLLKQNEWSIHNKIPVMASPPSVLKSAPSSSTASTAFATVVATPKMKVMSVTQQPRSEHPHPSTTGNATNTRFRTETNL